MYDNIIKYVFRRQNVPCRIFFSFSALKILIAAKVGALFRSRSARFLCETSFTYVVLFSFCIRRLNVWFRRACVGIRNNSCGEFLVFDHCQTINESNYPFEIEFRTTITELPKKFWLLPRTFFKFCKLPTRSSKEHLCRVVQEN